MAKTVLPTSTRIPQGVLVTPPEEKLIPENFKSYEDGKLRRYNLLFAVNGGAFAIVKLFAEKNAAAVLGHLSLRQLSIGMIVLTIVMVVDIFMFGEKMRRNCLFTNSNRQCRIVGRLILHRAPAV